MKKFKKNWKFVLPLIVLFVITIFSIAINGYFYGYETQGEVLIFIKTRLDNYLFKNDIVTRFIPYYFTYFYRLLAFPSKIFGVENTYFYVYFLSMYILHIIVFYLAKSLFKKDLIGYVAILLFIIDKPVFAIDVKSHYLVPRFFVLPLEILAIYFFINEKYILSSILAGLSMNFHFTSAHILFLMFMLYLILFYRKVGVKTIAKCAIAFLVFASPVIYWSVTNSAVPFTPPPMWLEMIKLKESHHLSPLFWGTNQWIRVSSFILVFILSLKYVPRLDDKHKKILTLLLGIVIFGVIGTISYYVYPISLLLTVQWWRSSVFFGVIVVIYLSNYLLGLYKRGLSYKTASVGLGVSIALSNFKGVLLFTLLVAALNFRKNVQIFRLLLGAFFLLAVLSALSSVSPNVPFYALKIGFVPLIVTCIAIIFSLVFEYSKKYLKNHSSKAIFGSILVLVLLTSILAGSLLVRKQLSIPIYGTLYEHLMFSYVNDGQKIVTLPIISKFFESPFQFLRHNVDFPDKLEPTDWRSVQLWAKENTEKSALFITPPYLDSFRAFSDRAVVMEFTDLGFVNFDVKLSNELWERATDICNSKLFGKCIENSCIELCKKNYNQFDERQFINLARKYNAEYVVVEKPKKLNFNSVYENEGFRIYKVK